MSQQNEPERKPVWIKCRVPGKDCPGNMAEIVMTMPNAPTGPNGSFVPEAGGKAIRYKCLTCKGMFFIRS